MWITNDMITEKILDMGFELHLDFLGLFDRADLSEFQDRFHDPYEGRRTKRIYREWYTYLKKADKWDWQRLHRWAKALWSLRCVAWGECKAYDPLTEAEVEFLQTFPDHDDALDEEQAATFFDLIDRGLIYRESDCWDPNLNRVRFRYYIPGPVKRILGHI